MDFARKQLEKYGWSDGKGLGKNEDGISQALKPKLKRSVAGIGHDAAADFTDHWWSQLYDKAAKNVEVEEQNGKTKKIKTKEAGEFEITNCSWKIKGKHRNINTAEQYKDFFIKKAILDKGGVKVENVSDAESEDKEMDKGFVVKMTDEELFAACEGRTAHKGARHGLKATGKLARIAQQEQLLLSQPQYNGYSHSKNLSKEKVSLDDLQVVEDINLNSDAEVNITKKKKKKRKRCSSVNNSSNIDSDQNEVVPDEKEIVSIKYNHDTSRKTKRNKKKFDSDGYSEFPSDVYKSKKKKTNLNDIDKKIKDES
ncbi:unnamed protein product [Diatraea saccharalis]|uniref:G patch domain-containing protein 4 n=1 Tax=Diatraea saccharalis TaxID=40085 RepID=A0A9N9RCU9_9NEOP|nr:unnamed protein product [Diatraea saccharalis]